MLLAQALDARQIRAAQKLHAGMTGWQEVDRALSELGERFPDFDAPSTLLKAIAVNSLYGTNVYAVYRMAKHIEQVLVDSGRETEPWRLVERIAALPGFDGKTARRHLSFASKFAHLFIDREQYAIKDFYAGRMLQYHLGRRNMETDSKHPYLAYLSNYRRLKKLGGLKVTNRQLDHYLWIAGQYRTWKRKPETRLSREVLDLFENPTPEAATELEALLPSMQDATSEGES